jgi:hypothetical protein
MACTRGHHLSCARAEASLNTISDVDTFLRPHRSSSQIREQGSDKYFHAYSWTVQSCTIRWLGFRLGISWSIQGLSLPQYSERSNYMVSRQYQGSHNPIDRPRILMTLGPHGVCDGHQRLPRIGRILYFDRRRRESAKPTSQPVRCSASADCEAVQQQWHLSLRYSR